MLLGGLWHGANWTFVVWGGIHGSGLAVERFLRRAFSREEQPNVGLWNAGAWVSRVVTFNLVCLTWVFFRASSVSEAWSFLRGLGTFQWRPEYGIAFRFLALFGGLLFVVDLFNESRDEEYVLERTPEHQRLAVDIAMMALVTLLAANQLNAFIYFRFRTMRAAYLLLAGCALVALAVEGAARLAFDHVSKIQRRTVDEYWLARTMGNDPPSQHKHVLMVGNSLLDEDVKFDRLRDALGRDGRRVDS